jgi:hypothetical protein
MTTFNSSFAPPRFVACVLVSADNWKRSAYLLRNLMVEELGITLATKFLTVAVKPDALSTKKVCEKVPLAFVKISLSFSSNVPPMTVENLIVELPRAAVAAVVRFVSPLPSRRTTFREFPKTPGYLA